jgi:hypothetical protein
MNVKRRLGSWARPIAGLLVLTLGLVTAAPAVAAEPAPAPQPLTLVAAASATVAAMPIPAGALAQATPATQKSQGADLGSKSFWKTTPGVLALAVMAGGTGYMVYSAFKDNDPVKSQWR